MKTNRCRTRACLWVLVAMLLSVVAPAARADVVTDANAKAADIASRHPGTAHRREDDGHRAGLGLRGRQRDHRALSRRIACKITAGAGRLGGGRGRGGDADGAARSSCRRSRRPSMPTIRRCSRPVPDGPAKTAGIAVGEQAATAVVASCADDGVIAPDIYRPTRPRRRLRADDGPGGAPLGQAPAVGHDQRRPVPPGPAAQPDERGLGAGLQRDQGARREEQHPAHAGADRHREVLGGDGPGRLLAGRALGRERARPRRHRQRAPVRGGGDGDGRRADRRVRRQVHLQLLASGHRHPQRRPRRQRRHRARSGLDAVHRHADAPRVSVRPLHRVGVARRRARRPRSAAGRRRS